MKFIRGSERLKDFLLSIGAQRANLQKGSWPEGKACLRNARDFRHGDENDKDNDDNDDNNSDDYDEDGSLTTTPSSYTPGITWLSVHPPPPILGNMSTSEASDILNYERCNNL
ncbi:hypothetical protein HZH68_003497 [Vespula germanica]|uniref:Uncharacterized protein n=1 Tax=Vespula germanica TaxID=30212 RepID=A0A834NPA0_VESGE|nr:hypothetical protein HZH68_003497 [Vespula germanica]